MTNSTARVTVSAGGVVINPDGEVLLVSQHGTSWSLPKGHIEPGEAPSAAAEREIFEEAGISDLSAGRVLGTYARYRMAKDGRTDTTEWKVLVYFLFRTRHHVLTPQDTDNPEARWVAPDKVSDALTHPDDRAFFTSISSVIIEDRNNP